MHQAQEDRLKRRMVEAVESIARSLEKLANPPTMAEIMDKQLGALVDKEKEDVEGPPWRVPGE